jgi:2'-5' RNA ligase
VENKTYKTALALVPPEEVWEPIQRIRREHDKQIRRWMPHITLAYPFRPESQWPALTEALREAGRGIEPFEVELEGLDFFSHGHSCTMWLSPRPVEALRRLQAALEAVVPDCNDVSQFADGFRPHLSVGQVNRKADAERLLASLAAGWRPLRFLADHVAMIRRDDPPDDVFRVEQTIGLGG